MKANILIAGGSSFIGHNLIKLLNKNNYNITSLSLKKIKNKNKIKNIEYIFCDISKKNNLRKKIKKNYDIFINFAGNVNHKDALKNKEVHYYGLKNILGIINKKKIKLLIQIGSSLEYGRLVSPQREKITCKPVSSYGKAKYLSSKYILGLGIKNSVILRPYQIYGPYQKKDRLIPQAIKTFLKNLKLKCTSGNQKRDFLYVDDFNRLILYILKKKYINPGIYNVGSGKPVKIKKIINLILKKINKGQAKFGSIQMRDDEINDLYPDISKIKKNFKWKPRISLKDGLAKTINFYLKKV